jgi:hypothetical protein
LRPLAGGARAATAFAASASAAEIATKSLMVAASHRTPLRADGSAAAVVVYEDGHVEIIEGSDPDACTFFEVEPSRRPA